MSQLIIVLGFFRLRQRMPIPFLNCGEGIGTLTSVDGVTFRAWWILLSGVCVRVERQAGFVTLLRKNRGRRTQKHYGHDSYSQSKIRTKSGCHRTASGIESYVHRPETSIARSPVLYLVSMTHRDVANRESELRTTNRSDPPRETEFSGKVFRAMPRH